MSRFADSSVSWRRSWRVLALLALCLCAGLAQAQSDADDSADPPTRVARLSYIGGDLGFLPAGAKDWSDANINRPLTTGDKLSSAVGARAELEFDGGTLRIDGQSDLGLLDLNDQMAQIELTQGSLSLSVRQLRDGESYEIDTPAVALVVDQPGTFRVDVDPRDGSTRVAALDGTATVFGENNAQRSINPGRAYRFGDASLSMVTISDINRGDAFDRWASERDRRYVQSTSRQYVSDDVVGYQDLDQYGAWQDSSEYGAVWYPRSVGADWAPYRNGHWAYIAPWGWSWVDAAPWGYAPYHYGRWAYTQRGWGWIPGPRGMRAVYAPALVAFVGGGGWSVGIGGGPVGWFPLGPGELYNPWYPVGRRYYTNININIYNNRGRGRQDSRRDIDDHYNQYRRGDFGHVDHYANSHAPRGFTAVSRRGFGDGHDVKQNLVHVDPRKLTGTAVRSGDIDRLRPTDGGDRSPRTTHVRNLPAGGFNREVVARRAPPDIHGAPVPNDANLANDNARGRVRVLRNQDLDQRPRMADRSGGNARRAPTPPVAAALPAVPRIAPASQGDGADMTRDNGELRSSRFAHPRGRDGADPRGTAPRPGVSYISGNTPAPSVNDRTQRPMPQAPRDNPRAAQQMPQDNPRPASYDRARYQREAPQSPVSNMPSAPEPRSVDRPQPRFQRSEPTPQREYVRDTPQPASRPSEPTPQRYEAPQRYQPQQRPEPPQQRYEPPQRSAPPPRAEAPQPRAEAPRPQQSSPRPPSHKTVERNDQEQQQQQH